MSDVDATVVLLCLQVSAYCLLHAMCVPVDRLQKEMLDEQTAGCYNHLFNQKA